MEKININSLDYYQNEPEGQFLDRKSARMKPKDILKHFVDSPMLKVVNWLLV